MRQDVACVGTRSGRRASGRPHGLPVCPWMSSRSEARVQCLEIGKAGVLTNDVYAVGTKIVAVQGRGRELDAGVVALEDQDVVAQRGGLYEARVVQTGYQAMEAAAESGEGEQLAGWEMGEDLDEDLVATCVSVLGPSFKVAKTGWMTDLAGEHGDGGGQLPHCRTARCQSRRNGRSSDGGTGAATAFLTARLCRTS